MDAKDSSFLFSSPATAVAPAVPVPSAGSKDGPMSDEGRVASNSPDAVELAKEAVSLFQSRRFAECVNVLNRLLMIKPHDPKVHHNIAVAEYFRDGCSDPKNLIDLLNLVKEKSEELANASNDQIEVGNSVGSNVISVTKANSTILQQFSGLHNGGVVYADVFDTSVAMLNIAVILYQLHDYAHALSVLQSLYQNIEPIDETTALHVCLMLLDVALACQDASKAADVIQYLEKSLNVGQTVNQLDNGSNIQHHSSQGAKVSTSNTSVLDASGSESSGSVNVPENSLSRTLSDETLEYETLYSTLDAGTQSSGRPNTECSKLSTDQTTSIVDLKLNLHLYKVRLLLLTRNLKAAKREIKLSMNVARFGDSSSALLLKSQLEYARGNYRKAIKLLMASSNRTEPGMLSMFNNNMGCIFHQLGKHHTASLFFSKALKSSTSLRSEKPLKLSTFSQDNSLVILYNCGLQYLVCGKPLVAVHCFNKARAIYYDRPILWLRFAECCLLALEKGLLRANGGSSSNNEELKVHVVGSGRWRRLVIDDISSTSRYLDCLGEDGLVTSDGQYRLSLPFARRCLYSALHLLSHADLILTSDSMPSKDEEDSDQVNPQSAKTSSHKNVLESDTKASNVTLSAAPANTNGDSKEIKGGVSANTTLQSTLSTYQDVCRKENNLIKQAVLVDLAYVELSLGNPLKALSATKALQELSDCSKIYLFLSHVYAAEALCHLSKPKEAAEHLAFYVSENNEIPLPYNDDDREKWRMDKGSDVEELNGLPNAKAAVEDSQGILFMNPEEARGVLYVNLATMYAIQGDIEKASQLVKEAMSALPNHPRATLAAIYVDILAGRKPDALVKLKECRHVRFLLTNVTLRST